MAEFNYKGLDELGLSFQEIVDIPDDIAYEMLEAAGDVVAEAQKRSLRSLGLVETNKLVNSITVHKKIAPSRTKDEQRYVLVYPEGKHGSYRSRVRTKTYARSKHGRTHTTGGKLVNVSNSEVGFIHEFGAPHKGIAASQWMSKANAASAEAAVAAEFAVYDEWLKSKNL